MRWKWILLLAVVGIGCYVNLIYYRPVTSLPANAELIAHMNSYDDVQVQSIVNRIQLDQHHYAVPVLYKTQQRGMSFWKWHNGSWRFVQVTTQKLLHWQLDEEDPATNYMVWHLDSQETLATDFHLIRTRYFLIRHDNEQYYYPRIQLTQALTLSGNGAQPFSDEWVTVLDQVKTTYNKPTFSFFSEGVPETFIFGMSSDEAFENGFGSTYITGEAKSTVSYFMYVNESELER